jgi:hypothetical protein
MSDPKSGVKTMTCERVLALIAAYGATPQRWPEDERAAAQAVIAAHAGAEDLLMSERTLDALLDRVESVPVPASLPARILAGFDEVAARPSVRRLIARISQFVWPNAPLWQPSAALAASLIAGVMLGIMSPLGGNAVAAPANSDMTIAFEVPQHANDGL